MRKALVFALPLALAASPAWAGEAEQSAGRAGVQEAFVEGDYATARKLVTQLLEASPQDADLLRRLAAIEAAEGDYEEAEATISRAIAIAPTDLDIRLGRANILFWNGKVEEAEREAAEVAAVSPDYPGLRQLQRSLIKAGEGERFRADAVSVGGELSSVEFEAGEEADWSTQRASLISKWGANNWASVELAREERAKVDVKLSAKVDVELGEHRVYARASATPSADFRESWSLGAGAELDLRGGTIALVEAGYADYSGGDVGTVWLGARHEFSKHVSVTAKTIHLIGGGEDYRLGGIGRLDLAPTEGWSFFAIAAVYPDVEADGAKQLRSVAGGLRFSVTERLDVSVAAAVDDRKDSYRRDSVSLDLKWKLGD
ncbi:tetratricopeptide repeat protein [Erythrobacter aureus]|uniref:YaiO family outer membrane beta-barrel protein n=1 Tax=Erythrobacter aureus TaxID=2182384 RepID=A0A345YIF3_9SPHN|nr:tetratricopeptide repeat protein [Erythrobacter aureus]AXK43705.1 YaiO family outer membrane beta-barrel protein [Erythrobacter aureus]